MPRLPRTRGDGPLPGGGGGTADGASPHTRGWTPIPVVELVSLMGFPAHAGMDPCPSPSCSVDSRLPRTHGDGPWTLQAIVGRSAASPHTRGWTRLSLGDCLLAHGFPAHAGMDPSPRGWKRPPQWLPRTRGDGPQSYLLKGMQTTASPHTRGWTRDRYRPAACRMGFPAHAGMDPSATLASAPFRGLPRTRGDGPDTINATAIDT